MDEKDKHRYERSSMKKLNEDIRTEPPWQVTVPIHSPRTGARFKNKDVPNNSKAPAGVCRGLGRALGVVDELNLTLWREALISRAKSSGLGICVRNCCGCLLGLVHKSSHKKIEDESPTDSQVDYAKTVRKADLPDAGNYAYGSDGLQFYHSLAKIESNAPRDAVGRPVQSFRPMQMMVIAKELFRIDPVLTEEEKELVNHKIARKLEARPLHFPWFLTIFTIIQVLALIILLAVYGFGDIGLDPEVSLIRDVVTIRGIEQVDMWTRPNIWLGPPVSGLIKAGSVYGPCMRNDSTIGVIVLSTISRLGQNLGCCVVSKHSVAATLTQNECDKGTLGGGQWNEGSCNTSLELKHMLRPCCYGLLGNCKMTTETGCDAQKGTFHKNKDHCSEVFCFPSFCGELGLDASDEVPFMPDTVNQGWRFLVSMIYLAGILHAILLLFFQWTVGKPIECMVGSVRMALVYLFASFGGNLVAAFMDPYSPHVGAGGGLTCLVAISIAEVIQCRKEMREHFTKEMILLVLLLVFIIIAGFAPLLNNFAHLGGVLFGLPLAYFLMPHLNFNRWYCNARKIIVGVSALIILILLLTFLLLFYLIQDTGACSGCYYFSCIPFTHHMCNIFVELIGTVSVD